MSTPIVVDKSKKYVIRSFRDRELALRMMAMGIRPGQEICIIGKSPFGASYFVQVGMRCMAARADELAAIDWYDSELVH